MKKRKYVKSGLYSKKKQAPAISPLRALLGALQYWWRDNGPSISVSGFGFWAQLDLGEWYLRPNYRPGLYSGHIASWLCFSARHPW